MCSGSLPNMPTWTGSSMVFDHEDLLRQIASIESRILTMVPTMLSA